MSTQKKSTALLSAVASSLLLAACAEHQSLTNAAAHPPMVVAGASTLSPADLYAQRYESSVAQVNTGGKHRFVSCESSCPGATPKTPIANIKAAVAKRVLENLRAGRSQVITTESTASDRPSRSAGAATIPPVAVAIASDAVDGQPIADDPRLGTVVDEAPQAANDSSVAARGEREGSGSEH